jgi:hypothetical protein
MDVTGLGDIVTVIFARAADGDGAVLRPPHDVAKDATVAPTRTVRNQFTEALLQPMSIIAACDVGRT